LEREIRGEKNYREEEKEIIGRNLKTAPREPGGPKKRGPGAEMKGEIQRHVTAKLEI